MIYASRNDTISRHLFAELGVIDRVVSVSQWDHTLYCDLLNNWLDDWFVLSIVRFADIYRKWRQLDNDAAVTCQFARTLHAICQPFASRFYCDVMAIGIRQQNVIATCLDSQPFGFVETRRTCNIIAA